MSKSNDYKPDYAKDLKLYLDMSKTLSEYRIVQARITGKFDNKLLNIHIRLLKRLALRLKINTLDINRIRKVREY